MIYRILLFLATLIATTSSVQANECSERDAYVAKSVVKYLNNWPNIHLAFQQFEQCDSGIFTEGYSYSIIHLLASNWKMLPELQNILNIDPSFKNFLLQHIAVSTDYEKLKKVISLTKSSCNTDYKELCTAIQESALYAIHETSTGTQ